ncbi:autotransporter domain-containing protein [Rickettsiales endosymbiont of Stachyamoeba lipophora]|uniref:autotransporter domain-containing protein n=1 Tax=Rickettsiales endosymbiont of Stachyamoeba lipophora TaxID=2486578 RepID=UPI0013DDCD3C|nr:autotransporter domain-containing protein [Rickettsiales endosymbiont of Stachyamoeba lipophora]
MTKGTHNSTSDFGGQTLNTAIGSFTTSHTLAFDSSWGITDHFLIDTTGYSFNASSEGNQAFATHTPNTAAIWAREGFTNWGHIGTSTVPLNHLSLAGTNKSFSPQRTLNLATDLVLDGSMDTGNSCLNCQVLFGPENGASNSYMNNIKGRVAVDGTALIIRQNSGVNLAPSQYAINNLGVTNTTIEAKSLEIRRTTDPNYGFLNLTGSIKLYDQLHLWTWIATDLSPRLTISSNLTAGRIINSHADKGKIIFTGASTATITNAMGAKIEQVSITHNSGTTTFNQAINALSVGIDGVGRLIMQQGANLGATGTNNVNFSQDGTAEISNGYNLTGGVLAASNNIGSFIMKGGSVSQSIGNATNKIKLFEAAENGNTTVTGNLYATNTIIKADNSLIVNGANIESNITSNTDNTGTLTLSGAAATTVTGNIGTSGAALKTVTGGTGFNTTYDGNIFAQTINSGANVSNFNGNISGNLNFTADGTANMAGSTLTGTVTTNTANTGVFNLIESSTITDNIGATNRLKLITTGAVTKTNILNGTVASSNITHGSGTSTFNNHVTITGGNISFTGDGIINLSDTTIDSAIDTVTISTGTLNVTGHGTVTGTIGAINALKLITAGNATKIANFSNAVTADTINIDAGTANFNGNVTGTLNFSADGIAEISNGYNLTGGVLAASNNIGSFVMKGGNLSQSIGDATNKIKLFEAAENGNTTVTGNLYATNTIIKADNSLIVNGANIDSDITSNTDNTGTLTLSGAATTVTGNIGASGAALKTVTGGTGFNTTYDGNIFAQTINSGANVSNFNGNISGNLNFTADGTANIAPSKNIAGIVTTTDNNATLNFLGATNINNDIAANGARLKHLELTGDTNLNANIYAYNTNITSTATLNSLGARTIENNVNLSGNLALGSTSSDLLTIDGNLDAANTAAAQIKSCIGATTTTSLGRLKVTGDLTLRKNATIMIDRANPNLLITGNYDLLEVDGNVLDNSANNISLADLKNNYITLNNLGQYMIDAVTKNANIYSITISAAPSNFTSVTTNTYSVSSSAQILDNVYSKLISDTAYRSSVDNSFIEKIEMAAAYTGEALSNFVNKVAINTTDRTIGAIKDISTNIFNVVSTRLENNLGNNNFNIANNFISTAKYNFNSRSFEEDSFFSSAKLSSANQYLQNAGIWVQSINHYVKQTENHGDSGYRERGEVKIFGYDRNVNEHTLLGIAIATSRTNTHFKNLKLGDKLYTRANQMNLYGSHLTDKVKLDLVASYGYAVAETLTQKPFNEIAKGKYRVKNYALSGKASFIAYSRNDYKLMPSLGINYQLLDQPAYSETASSFGRSYDKKTTDIGAVTLGTKLQLSKYQTNSLDLIPSINLAYKRDLTSTQSSSTSYLTNAGELFKETLRSAKTAKDTYTIAASLDIHDRHNLKFNLTTSTDLKNKYRNSSLILKLRYEF